MNSKPIPYEEFKAIYSRVPRLCIEVIVRNGKGIVLTRRARYSYVGMWHMPGATLLYQERVEDAVRRIAKDELGIEVSTPSFLAYIENLNETNDDENGGNWTGHAVGLAMLCDLAGGTLRPNEDASQIDTFFVLPDDMIPEQRTFLSAHWPAIMKGV